MHTCPFQFWTSKFMGPPDSYGTRDDVPAATPSWGAWIYLLVLLHNLASLIRRQAPCHRPCRLEEVHIDQYVSFFTVCTEQGIAYESISTADGPQTTCLFNPNMIPSLNLLRIMPLHRYTICITTIVVISDRNTCLVYFSNIWQIRWANIDIRFLYQLESNSLTPNSSSSIPLTYHEQWAILRATVDLEPKIRTADENLILLPKKKTIVSVGTTNVRSYVYLFISRNHLLKHCLILDFLLVIVTKNIFSLACFFNQLNAKPSLENQLS